MLRPAFRTALTAVFVLTLIAFQSELQTRAVADVGQAVTQSMLCTNAESCSEQVGSSTGYARTLFHALPLGRLRQLNDPALPSMRERVPVWRNTEKTVKQQQACTSAILQECLYNNTNKDKTYVNQSDTDTLKEFRLVEDFGAFDIGIGAVTGKDSTAAVSRAMMWCAKQKNGIVDVGNARIAVLSGNVVVPSGCTLRFPSHTGWRNDGVGYQNGIVNTRGAIVLSSLYTILNGGILENPAIFPAGLSPPTSTMDAYRKINMFSGTAITVSGPDTRLTNPYVVGFGTCFSDTGFERPWIDDGRFDCTNGVHLEGVQDTSHIIGLHGYAFYLNDIDGTPFANVLRKVSGVSDDGTGLIRLTLNSTRELAAGMVVNIRNVSGFEGANGRWPIKVVDDTHVDLIGSSFKGVSTIGSWKAGETMMKVTSTEGLYYGMSVRGTGIMLNTIIRTIDWRLKIVWLSKKTDISEYSQAIIFGNNLYAGGGDLVMDNLYRSGSFIRVIGGFENHFTDIFEYGWHTGAHITNGTWNIFSTLSCDSVQDPTTVCMWIDGTTTLTEWNGGTSGGTGAAIFDDVISPVSTNSITAVNIRNNVGSDPSYIMISLAGSGNRQLLDLFSPSGGVVSSIAEYVSAGKTLISGFMPYLDLYPQNASALDNITLSEDLILAAGSPYSYEKALSFMPLLIFEGNVSALTQRNYGQASVAWPWLTLKININLISAPISSENEATVTGQPFQCEVTHGSSGGGGLVAFTSGMRSLSGPVVMMAQGDGSTIGLYQMKSTGSSALVGDNFTSKSRLDDVVRCKMQFLQR